MSFNHHLPHQHHHNSSSHNSNKSTGNYQTIYENDISLNESTISYRSSIPSNTPSTAAATTTGANNKAAKHLPPLSVNVSRASTFATTPRNTSASSIKTTTSSKISSAKSDNLLQNIEVLVSRNKLLEEENSVLKNLIGEENNKTIDERRILMLKCQVYQLEKQINILSKRLTFRKHAHTEALSAFTFLSETLRSITVSDDMRNKISSNVCNVEKQDILKWLELCESTRNKLAKSHNESYDENDVDEPSLFSSEYSKTPQETSLLDICSGNINHINVKQVAPLESNLAGLFKKLIRLRESLKTVKNPKRIEDDDGDEPVKTNIDYMPIQKENLCNIIDDSLKSCNECCTNLFNLSLLIPSAPWASIRKCQIKVVREEDLIQKLKSFNLPKTKYVHVEMLLKSFFISSNCHIHMKNIECLALNEELNFYRATYSLQKSYIDSVLSSFKAKYKEVINDQQVTLKNPLKQLIDKFWQMKDETTEENLKIFLEMFKFNSAKFDVILQKLDKFPDNNFIDITFDQILIQINNQIVSMNNACLLKLKEFNRHIQDTQQVSLTSDELLSDIVKIQNLDVSNVTDMSSSTFDASFTNYR